MDEETKQIQRTQKMVEVLARRTRRRYPETELDDLISAGHEAALLAKRTFDASRGVPFELFAMKRIRGGMIRYATGEVFETNPLKRAVYQRATGQDMIPRNTVTMDDAVDESPSAIRHRAVQWARERALALAVTALWDPLEVAQEDQLEGRQLYRRAHTSLAELVEQLPADEKTLIEVHYKNGGTLTDVADQLGISRRTVLRLHEKVKDRLGKQLRRAGVDSAPDAAYAEGEEEEA